MKFRTGYYQADTINGVYYIGDAIEDTDMDITRPRLFLALLADLPDDDYIVTYFDETTQDIFEEIVSNYVINTSLVYF